MSERYIAIKLNGGEAYVRRDRLNQLRKVDAVIFDCDGVLIDVRGSYDRTISKTSAYIFENLTGHDILDSLISNDAIFMFRRSGGFNNDWDITYGILMFSLCSLPEKLTGALKKRIDKVRWQHDPFKRLSAFKQAVKEEFDPEDFGLKILVQPDGVIDKLEKFTGGLDSSGSFSVDRKLVTTEPSESFVEFYNALKRFLCYPGEVGESIIATVFEEFFCGAKLFHEMYGLEPRFCNGLGMIDNGRVILRHETLDSLTSILGKAKFGIASGSRLKPARYTLGDLLDRFDATASIFLDTMERAERKCSREGSKGDLKKPNPFSLFKAVEALSPFDFALYVGDSMEDAIMVSKANRVDSRFLFAGVYYYSSCGNAFLRDFLKYGCDIVVPSVEELPLILKQIGERRDEGS